MTLLVKLGVTSFAQAKRLIKIVVGFTLLAIGIALIFLPGPAFIVIPASLGILAGEFLWARKLLHKFNHHISNMIKNKKAKKDL